MQGYRITTDVAEMDLQVIHGFLASSYWAKDIPLATLQRAMDNSLCFGVLTDDGEQVAFARMITDRTTYAYLADVFVVETQRGKGIATWLLRTMLDHPDLQGLRRIRLVTRDAQDLYARLGCKALSHPERTMELVNADVYKTS